MYKVYEKKPTNFKEELSVVACYLEVNDKILFLQRSKNSTHEGAWGVPAGKVEKNEDPFCALIREVYEETKISLVKKDLTYLTTLWIEIPNVKYSYLMFYVKTSKKLSVELNHENINYKWLKVEEAKSLNLMMGAEEALDCFQRNRV